MTDNSGPKERRYEGGNLGIPETGGPWSGCFSCLSDAGIPPPYSPSAPILGLYPQGTLPLDSICVFRFSSRNIVYIYSKCMLRDLPGGAVAKTANSQCRGPGFHPCSGN